MNRRHFLQSGSLAIAAVAGLPRAVKSMNRNAFERTAYRTTPVPYKAGQWLYEVQIDHNGFESFGTAQDTDKVIILKAAWCETSDITKPTTKGEFKYVIKSAEKDAANSSYWYVNTRSDSKISGDLKLPKIFPKNPRLRCLPYGSIEIFDKEKTTGITLTYPETSSSNSEGCFLTTACVDHKGLADNCQELDTLRYLRDNYMMGTEDGKLLVKAYALRAPQLVKTIDSFDNRDEIYDYMYSNMIQPAVQLVKEGRMEEAVDYYCLFTKALEQQYGE